MRKLYLANGNSEFKFADTTTKIILNAFDNGIPAELTADTKVRVKNNSGYLLEVSASVINGQAVITSGQLAQLPHGIYLLELWDTVNGGTAIYPSDGFVQLQINENATSLSGKLISSITVDDFIQQFSDLSQQLKKEASAVGWSSEVADKINNAIKGLGHIIMANDLVAPYDSLDTLPPNSVVTYGFPIKGAVKSVPIELSASAGATVITYSSNDVPGSVQILVGQFNDFFYRISWKPWTPSGQFLIWSNWTKNVSLDSIKTAEPHFFIDSELDSESVYKDLNNLTKNQVVTYAIEDMSNIKNAPSNVGGTLIVYSAGDRDDAGQAQIFITENNDAYHRISWRPRTSGVLVWSNWTNTSKKVVYKPAPSIAMFEKNGIIGDSYASGELAFDYNYKEQYEISWGQILARKNGVNAINFSRGGLWTRSWLADDHGFTLLNSSDAQDLYICALGLNDIQRGGENYIGSESDIDSSADTFYGNYGKIIKAIQSKAPNSKIVISTLASQGSLLADKGLDGLIPKYNAAIETIAKHFGISLIKQEDDPFFTSDYYLNHMYGEHPTAPVYAEMANAIERLISQQMVDNLSYFETYKK